MRGKPELENRIRTIVTEWVGNLVNEVALAVRTDVVNELRSFFTQREEDEASEVQRITNRLMVGRLRTRRSMTCIAPGCKNVSKGPRFHYLCEEHAGVPAKDYQAWQKARRARLAGERADAAEGGKDGMDTGMDTGEGAAREAATRT
ncbi:MAG: hypothetical protein V2A73_13995 [Pseudomonadota bacterium]